MMASRADVLEGTVVFGNAGLAVVVITPAHGDTVMPQCTGMIVARAYPYKATGRSGRLAVTVPSPAHRAAILSQRAGMDAARAYLRKATGRSGRLAGDVAFVAVIAVIITTPALRAAVLS